MHEILESSQLILRKYKEIDKNGFYYKTELKRINKSKDCK